MGLFITFEGGEGCGKSTQARMLLNRLTQCGIEVVVTREPGGTVLGDEIRKLLKKERPSPVAPEAELLLVAASRAQLMAELIGPALDKNTVIICDRFIHSTLAYQGYGRGLDLDAVTMVHRLAAAGIKPDLVVLLDIPPEEGLGRKRTPCDRFESECLSFHERVRDGYLKMAAAEPDRWLVVDASLTPVQVARVVWEGVSKLLGLPA